MRLTEKMDDIEKIILDFNAPFTENIIKSILLLIQYLNNNDLSDDNQISNVDIINLNKTLMENQGDHIESLILSSIPQKNADFSLFAIYFGDSWTSLVFYINESKIYAKYNDSSGNIIPDLLEKVLNDLQSNGIIDAWEDCQTTIPGGRSNDSGPKTIRNLLEMVYKPDIPLKNIEMPLKYYEILRISYVLCHVFIDMLDTLETRTYLSDLLQTTHNSSDVEHRIDWLKGVVKDLCLRIKDNNPSPNYARVLNTCEEALKNLSVTSSTFDQDTIPQHAKELEISDTNLISKDEEQHKYNSLESNDLDDSISPLKLDSSEDYSNIVTAGTRSKDLSGSRIDFASALAQTSPARIETAFLNLGKIIHDTDSNLTNNTSSIPIQTKSASFDATVDRTPPFSQRFTTTRSFSGVTITNEIDDSHYQDDDMMHTVNLESTLRGNHHDDIEQNSNFKSLAGEVSSVCKTH